MQKKLIDLENLYHLSDIPLEEYKIMKEQFLNKGESNRLEKYLIGRSTVPRLRNTVRPPGENYAPVFYNEDYMIKLVHKPNWGGHILTLVVWDLVIIDIDVEEIPGIYEDHLSYIQKSIEKHYPNDLFYINKTSRGYHVYLMSRMLKYSSKAAIYMRLKLNSDPAHATNSLYSGSSVRLTSKLKGDNNPIISEFLCKVGTGALNLKAEQLYNDIQSYIKKYSKYGVENIISNKELMEELYSKWSNIPEDFGKTHISISSPLTLNNEDSKIILHWNFSPFKIKFSEKVWNSFLKYRVIKINRLNTLLMHSHYQICMNNLYRILHSTEDYAIGIHVQESCYFISYRDLFYVDIDHKNRLKIIFQYVRYHPEATFRIVKTNKGYHAFLTSYPIPYDQCMDLSLRLCADHCHLLSVRHRGYSVRINQKIITENPYKEILKVGRALECPRLYALYLKHLELYEKNCADKCTIYLYQNTTAINMLEKDGLVI